MHAATSGPMSRAKTFKKSLRESFRRLRGRRGQAAAAGGDDAQKKSPKASPKKSKPESPKKDEGAAAAGTSSIEAAPG